MKSSLQRITIKGLHGKKTVDVKISDNILILVGENGSGKTTFLRIIFNFLSGRWVPLINYKFDYISAFIDGSEVRVTREDIVKAVKADDRHIFSDFPPSIRRRLMELMERGDFDRASLEMERLGFRFGHPFEKDSIKQFSLFGDRNRSKNALKELHNLKDKISTSIDAQILYLPTYRRIERELGSIFEGLDADDIKRNKRVIKQLDDSASFVELVEFGMKDVQAAIDKTLESLKEFARENLNNLTLQYLGDIVNGEYKNVRSELINVSDEIVSAVLNRTHDDILTKAHKDHIFQVINSTRSSPSPSEHDKIIYHYFLKLLRFQQSLQEKEASITKFCEVCSEYIVDKKFVYDGAAFSFKIKPKNSDLIDNEEIDPSDLSSGEKQIVSLFSHLYLSGEKRFFVLIDEPELSLSVPWQRRFLIDILAGDFCAGLIAVTHSPCIYDTNLKAYAHSLGEFVSV